MGGAQVDALAVPGDDSSKWEIQVARVAHYEAAPSGQVSDGERSAALEGFDAGFERVDSFLVGFEACHSVSFPGFCVG